MIDYRRLSTLLVQDLSEHVRDRAHFEQGGSAPPEVDARQFACYSLRDSFFKKLAPDGRTPDADAAAEKKFLARLPNVGLREPVAPLDDLLLGQFSHNMWVLLEDRDCDSLDLAALSARLVPGPGKSLDQNTGNFFQKYFQGPLSASSDRVIALFRACLMDSPSWAFAEKQRFEEFGFTLTDTSKGFFAKKNVQESRFCCTEPGVNMLFQLALGKWILDRLRGQFGIDLSNQAELNKELAQVYSMTDDGVTIDLTSASDSISVALVSKYLPPTISRWLMTFRTTHTLLPKHGRVELPMVSTMGNGFTFPLQCAIFACIVRTAYQLSGSDQPVGPRNREWGVFGDDIICPRGPISSKVKRLLYLLGMEVNVSKTFESGPFRESCGGDFYLGSNVRGVYIRSLETAALRFSAINRLLRWSAYHGILLRETISGILAIADRWEKYVVPPSLHDDGGVHVPESFFWPGDRPERITFLQPRSSKRSIGFDSPEYLGYNWGLYVSLLGGYVSSSEPDLLVERPFVGPPALSVQQRRDKTPDILIPLRGNQGERPCYDKRTVPYPWYWDWKGDANRLYDGSWEAVVKLTLNQ